jgi:hypothetical protein
LIKPASVSRRGGELLLRLLEQNRPVIAAAALEELFPDAWSTLLNLGALEAHGTSRAAIVAGDDGPEFRDLAWQADRNAYGYFEASDGNVVLAREEHALIRLALPWWLSWLAASLDLTNSSHPTEIVPACTWDIGDLWITRHRKIPVVFVRRLHLDATLQALREALEKRAGRSGGLILTSSRNPLRQVSTRRSFEVTPIAELLTNDSHVFAIDRELLLSPYVATNPYPTPAGPLYLSPDGRRLVINGTVSLDFGSEVQIAIIRRLVGGHSNGTRWRARELLGDAGSGVATLARAFGSKKWAQLKPYLRARSGLWGFDL